eukprot:gene11798-biopygen10938
MADPCTTPRGPSSGGEGGSCVLPAQLRGEDGVQRAGAGRRRSRHCGAVILPSQKRMCHPYCGWAALKCARTTLKEVGPLLGVVGPPLSEAGPPGPPLGPPSREVVQPLSEVGPSLSEVGPPLDDAEVDGGDEVGSIGRCR